ncbi:MAG: hypothetical protein FD165_464 [Gammaproteobacteria bacterium]|nr:MAG: hypothetical protein FD165_464 [Gammaproteobacteria bacterium]TND02274.1 MAG: hypothetical protein FD120_2438 [Gammaproteobacteria bacterium]
MALRHSAFYSPYLMTIAGGYLQDEGLEPQYAAATRDRSVADGFASGTCHVAQSAVATSFAGLDDGATPDIVHFAQINSRDGFFIVARRPDPEFSWSRLAGADVLVDHFFQPLAMLRYGLHRQGVVYESLHAIDAGGVDEMGQAFRAGIGAYVHLQGPAAQQLEHDGVGHVVAAVGDAVGEVAFSSLCARRAWLSTDMAGAFMRAYRRALACVLTVSPADIAAQLQRAGFFVDVDRLVLTETIRAYRNLGCWRADPEISRGAYDNLLDVFSFNRMIETRHPFHSAIVAPPG